MARRRSPREQPLDVEAVLSRRQVLDARALVGLIHRVNPTGLDLPAAEAARRYAVKSRLQALLIRQEPGALTLREVSPDRRTVLLFHTRLEQDACHAVLEELEEDARAWARVQLHRADAGEDAPPAVKINLDDKARRSPEADPEDLLERARQAVAEYDFEAARTVLEQALARSRGGSAAALPLLELLVDQLALDADALALVDNLDDNARAHPGVRSLVALAAARLGRAEEAQRWLQGVDGPRGADVCLALAQHALTDGDAERAVDLLVQARSHDGQHPGLLALEGEINALRARLRLPAEQRLQDVVAQQRWEEAAALAQDVVARWPESAVARRTLAEVERQRARERAAQCLRDAEDAAARDDLETAAVRLEQALELLPEAPPELVQRARETRARAAARQEQAHVQAVAAELGRGGGADGLRAYAGLPPRARAAVRERVPRRELGWLESALLPEEDPAAVVHAVLALAEAEQALRAGEAGRALEVLAPQERWLRRVPDARDVAARAGAEVRQAQERAAQQSLQDLHGALEQGDLDQAVQRAESLDPARLPPQEREAASALLSRVAEQRALRAQEQELEALAAQGDLLTARAALDAAWTTLPAPARARWEERRADWSKRIQVDWCVGLHTGPDAQLCTPTEDLTLEGDGAQAWRTPEGHLVLVSARGPWLLVRELEDGRVLRAWTLRAPQPMDPLWRHGVAGDVLRVAGAPGLLDLRLRDGAVQRWLPWAGLLPARAAIQDVHLPGRTDFAWLQVHSPGQGSSVVVVDLARAAVARVLPDVVGVVTLPTPDAASVLCMGRDGDVRRYTPRGTPLADRRAEWDCPLLAGAALPDGATLAVVMGRPEHGAVGPGPAGVLRVGSDGARTKPLWLPGGAAIRAAVAVGEGGAFVVVEAEDAQGRRRQLVALDVTGGPRVLWSVPVHPQATLVHDDAGARPALLWPGPHAFHLLPLGLEPPAGTASPAVPTTPLPLLRGPFPCDDLAGDRKGAARTLLAAYRALPAADQAGWLDSREAPEWVLLASSLRAQGEEAEFLAVEARAVARFSRDPGVDLVHASVMAQAGRWEDVHRLLSGLAWQTLDEPRAQHVLHLLGLAFWHLGHAGDALRAWTAGLQVVQGHCALEGCIHLARPLSVPPAPEERDGRQPTVRQLRGALEAADYRAARGDGLGALEELDRPVVWAQREFQAHARLLHLLREHPGARPGLATWLAAATVLECRRARGPVLHVPGVSWPPARLSALVQAAETLLVAPPGAGC